jgi:hypothetical protein
MKVKTYACYCCSKHHDGLVKPLDNPCEDSVCLGHMQPCYHSTVSDKRFMQWMKEERDEHLHKWIHLQHLPINRQTCLCFGENGMNNVFGPENDNLHIEFEPKTRHKRVENLSCYRNIFEKFSHVANQAAAELKTNFMNCYCCGAWEKHRSGCLNDYDDNYDSACSG